MQIASLQFICMHKHVMPAPYLSGTLGLGLVWFGCCGGLLVLVYFMGHKTKLLIEPRCTKFRAELLSLLHILYVFLIWLVMVNLKIFQVISFLALGCLKVFVCAVVERHGIIILQPSW